MQRYAYFMNYIDFFCKIFDAQMHLALFQCLASCKKNRKFHFCAHSALSARKLPFALLPQPAQPSSAARPTAADAPKKNGRTTKSTGITGRGQPRTAPWATTTKNHLQFGRNQASKGYKKHLRRPLWQQKTALSQPPICQTLPRIWDFSRGILFTKKLHETKKFVILHGQLFDTEHKKNYRF